MSGHITGADARRMLDKQRTITTYTVIQTAPEHRPLATYYAQSKAEDLVLTLKRLDPNDSFKIIRATVPR